MGIFLKGVNPIAEATEIRHKMTGKKYFLSTQNIFLTGVNSCNTKDPLKKPARQQ